MGNLTPAEIQKISERYVSAIQAASNEAACFDAVQKDLFVLEATLAEILQSIEEIPERPSDYAVIAAELLVEDAKQDESYHQVTRSFLHLIKEEKRDRYFSEILSSFKQSVLKQQGHHSITIETFQLLNEEQLDRLCQVLKPHYGDNLSFHQEVKKELLGGFRFYVNSTLVDCSLQSRMQQIENSLKEVIS